MTKEIRNTSFSDYKAWLDELKQQIATARRNASISLNSALIKLYWHIGSRINRERKRCSMGQRAHRPPCPRLGF